MIRETKKFKHILAISCIQAFLLLFSACVPVEKRTECGSGEAFNSNLRVCVPTIGTNSSLLYIESRQPQNNITDSVGSTTVHNFSIIVNDVYSAGYNINWQIRTPSNSVTFLKAGSGTSPNTNRVDFVPSTGATEGAGTYQLEVNILDNTNSTTIASTAWTINIVNVATPSIVSTNPEGNSLSVTANQATMDFSVAFNIPSGAVANATWVLNGDIGNPLSPLPGGLTTTSTVQVSPSALNFGINFLSVNIGNGPATIYDTHSWTIYKAYPQLGFIVGGGDSTNPQTSGTSPDPNVVSAGASPTQVIAIDGVSIADTPSGFKLGTDGSDITGGTGQGFCIYVGDYTGTRGLAGESNVFVRFKLDGSLLGGNIDFSGNGATNKKCLTDATGFNTFTLGLPPTLQDIGTTKTITAEVCDKGLNGDKMDCGNGHLAYTYTWTVNVRAKNTAPVIGSDTTVGSPPATNTTDNDSNNDKVDMVQDLAKTFTLSITDDDSLTTNNADFQVRWYINGILLDGTNLFPDSDMVTPDCYETYDEDAPTPSPITDKYNCDITVPSFLTTGPNNTTSYTLTAVVSDTSKYPGGINKDSNMLTWILNVTETQTAPVIQPTFGTIDPDNAPATFADNLRNSCFALQSDPDNCIATSDISDGVGELDENSDYIFKIRVVDAERDNYWRRIEMCKTFTVGQPASTASDCTILSGDQYIQNPVYANSVTSSEYVFRMPETAVKEAATGMVHFRITIQDVPTTVASTTVETEVISVEVNNNNPAPTIDTETAAPKFTPELPLITYDVYAGMPFTFYPGVVTDNSKADGAVATYQWQVCASGSCAATSVDWVNITGATKETLTWTPPTSMDGQTVQIRACIGDDGIGNEVANCGAFAGPWTNIVVRKSHVKLLGQTPEGFTHFPTGEMATWYDISQDAPTQYTAYSTGEYPNAGVVVEKVAYMGDGLTPHVGDIRSVHFPTEVSGNSGAASDLSIAGDSTTNSVYVAYKVKDELTIPQNLTTIRIRRIFTQNALFGFSYSGINFSFTLPPGSVTPFQIAPQGNNDATAEIDIVDTFWVGETLTINGADITEGVDVNLNGLSTDQAAEALATYINNSTDQKLLYKVFATRSGSKVILTGLPTNDYVDVQLYAKELGSIMYDPVNQKVHLPFIDGLNNDKISIVSLSTQFHLGDTNNNSISYLQLDSTDGSQEVESAYSEKSGYYYIATKNYNGYLALHAYDEFNSSAVDKKTGADNAIFSKTIDKIRIGVSTTGNSFIFLGATDSTGNLMLARLNEDNFLGNSIAGNSIETDLINSIKQGTRSQPGGDGDQFKGLSDFKIVAVPDEPQRALLFTSTNNDAAVHVDPSKRRNVYLTKITTDDDTVVTSPITLINTQTIVNFPAIDLVNGYNTVENFEIAISPYVKDRTFGLSGNTTNENQKDMVFVNYVVGDEVSPSAISQFLNVEEETIHATEYNHPDGFAPPFIEKIEVNN